MTNIDLPLADELLPEDPRPVYERLDLREIGRLVTPYFTRREPWAQRHVETVALRSHLSARRKVTVDIVLPHDSRCSVPWSDGKRLFYLPVTTIAKHPATSNIDLVDEDGRVLPILNRDQNAVISSIALRAAAREILGGPLSLEARAALRAVCRESGENADLARVVAWLRLGLVEFPDTDPACWRHLMDLVRDLAGNSVLWLGVIGHPGERRVLKFAYDMEVEVPPLPRRKRHRRELPIAIPSLGEAATPDLPRRAERFGALVEEAGDGDTRSNVRRLVDRIANSVALAAIDIVFWSPYVAHTDSYHLQVAAPDGIEIRRLRLHSVLSRNGKRAWPIEEPVTPTQAHVHFGDATIATMGPASVSFRVGRRAFLSHCLLACGLISAMLWTFWGFEPVPPATLDSETAAAILLLVPALLVAFVARPGEHALVAQLIAGPRLMLLACGCLSVIDALALIKPQLLGLELERLWYVNAIVATGITAVLALAWLFSLGSVETLRRRVRRFSRAYGRYATLGFLVGALMLVGTFATSDSAGTSTRHLVLSAWLASGSLFVAWLALFSSETRRPRYSRVVGNALALAAFCGLLIAPLYVGFDGWGYFSWSADVRYLTIGGITLALVLILATEVARRLGFPRGAPPEDEDLRKPGAMAL